MKYTQGPDSKPRRRLPPRSAFLSYLRPFEEPHLSFIKEGYSKGTEFHQTGNSKKKKKKRQGKGGQTLNLRKEDAEPGHYLRPLTVIYDSRESFRTAIRECYEVTVVKEQFNLYSDKGQVLETPSSTERSSYS